MVPMILFGKRVDLESSSRTTEIAKRQVHPDDFEL